MDTVTISTCDRGRCDIRRDLKIEPKFPRQLNGVSSNFFYVQNVTRWKALKIKFSLCISRYWKLFLLNTHKCLIRNFFHLRPTILTLNIQFHFHILFIKSSEGKILTWMVQKKNDEMKKKKNITSSKGEWAKDESALKVNWINYWNSVLFHFLWIPSGHLSS